MSDILDKKSPVSEVVNLKDNLTEAIPRLIADGKYITSCIVIIVGSMTFICALAIRDLITACVNALIEVDRASWKQCGVAALDGFLIFIIMFVMSIISIRCYILSAPITTAVMHNVL